MAFSVTRVHRWEQRVRLFCGTWKTLTFCLFCDGQHWLLATLISKARGASE